ncbi:hypothetical protein ANAPC5_00737 [Anaplasma phagocytophilum]|nr:hypothetical protein ANAPC2_00085 [Anaplasma phagocytophilum]SBO30423.1 hypothetical protein ANAPC3_00201 [Anaplasma phagocytophilum]SBO32437.1 hypothetical protein ANAPC4_00811 [Anaplasma phagocytophilum]SCV63999.1 hypothetical protein ANAPC5_00737 [Anaplasma phagocytophilum]
MVMSAIKTALETNHSIRLHNVGTTTVRDDNVPINLEMAATQDGNTLLHALLIHMLRNKDNGNIKPGHIETLKTLVSQRAPFSCS